MWQEQTYPIVHAMVSDFPALECLGCLTEINHRIRISTIEASWDKITGLGMVNNIMYARRALAPPW